MTKLKNWRPTPVWMDVDCAIGLPRADVDDGLALVQAFHSPELEVRGVSAVFGNAPLNDAVLRAREVVARFGPPALEVYPGAASSADRGKETAAVRAMAAALGRGRLTILALGPVTNIATLLALHPELGPRIDAVVVVAGRRPGQRFTTGTATSAHRDFNFELDPEGMADLLRSPASLVLVPWEVSSQVAITPKDLDDLGHYGESGWWLADRCRGWMGFWKESFGVEYFNPFDTLAVAWLTHPGLIEQMEAGAWIEEGPDDIETTVTGRCKPYLLVAAEREGWKRITYCFRPREDLKPEILSRLARPAGR